MDKDEVLVNAYAWSMHMAVPPESLTVMGLSPSRCTLLTPFTAEACWNIGASPCKQLQVGGLDSFSPLPE